ncbi:class II aaRS and biotin synthetase [Rhizoclosmatium globosum]|uniref:Class II aaRS and biotin synthetase n=1 Tax=Rhizoclosmatium globosum TaxID=329046 RepID=A0A1Y2BQ64_9FUNG|nr:class II aaRS and biotin synthetase [Rhizoclosmatium globosum]|eukprot:ORY36856.1 class II aaRS and biotin synthetase [Rhizoclosmatium globosum]
MNVLIYNGPGTAKNSTERTIKVLKAMLKGRFDVLAVGPDVLLHEDKAWQATTSLLVIPGGRDLPYVESLGTVGTNAIKQWVKEGGRYLGICAGAYFGSKRVEFEVGTPLEVVGDRKLCLVEAIAKGSATPGFVYNTEDGARSVGIRLNSVLGLVDPEKSLGDNAGYQFNVYCNGAPYFHIVDSSSVEVLATYESSHVTNVAAGKPAIVQSRFGKGFVVLCGPHLEHSLAEAPSLSDLADWDKHQRRLLECILARMGLTLDPPASFYMNETQKSDPLVLSIIPELANTAWISNLVRTYGETTAETGLVSVKDTVNSFSLVACKDPSHWEFDNSKFDELNIPILYSADGAISPQHTDTFTANTFFEHLKADRKQLQLTSSSQKFGTQFLYAKSTSSTQTILEKNYKLSTHLPSGLVCLASHQYSGRGRGANSWVSQDGCLQFSMTLHHRDGRSAVFLQYLFGLAVAEGICSIEGYSEIPIRLKWPNDIYCYTKDVETGTKVLKKIGGILVNSSYMDGLFNVVIGCGLNVANSLPTLSVNDLIKQYNEETGKNLPPLTLERVLARILTTFESMYLKFLVSPTLRLNRFWSNTTTGGYIVTNMCI